MRQPSLFRLASMPHRLPRPKYAAKMRRNRRLAAAHGVAQVRPWRRRRMRIDAAPRPFGVTVLAVSMLFAASVGGFLLVEQARMLGAASLVWLRAGDLLLFGASGGLGVLAMFVAPFGLWTGKRWGWFLADFALIFDLVSFACTLSMMIVTPSLQPQNEEVRQLLMWFYAPARLGIPLAWATYLGTEFVTEFFRIDRRRQNLILVEMTLGSLVLAAAGLLIPHYWLR